MIKSSSTAETDAATIDIINRKILRHTIQFFNKDDKGRLKPFASGVLLYTHGAHFILTASHVADYLEKDENDLYIRVDKKNYVNVLGDIKYTHIEKSKGIDLAYIKIDPQMVKPLSQPYEFLTIDKVRNHNQRLDGMNYCVIGFPEVNVSRESGTMETGANFYLTPAMNEKPYKHYGFDPNNFFLVEMKGKGTDVKTGGTVKVDPHFYGISGCGLWYLMYTVNPQSGAATVDYRLIGIMTEFKKGKFYCLIANKIHLMIEAFKVIEGFKYNVIDVP